MKVRISVTQADIDRGHECRSTRCPIAFAVRRALPPRQSIAVGNTTLGVVRNGVVTDILLPLEARRFVTEFDSHRLVRPFEFDLDVPDDLAPAGAA